MTRTATVAAAAGIACLLVSLSLTDRGLFRTGGVGDTGHYQQYGERVVAGGVPYRDFFIEFPPLAIPVLALPAVGPDGWYVPQFKALETAFLAAAILFLALIMVGLGRSRGATMTACVIAGVAPGVLGPISISSFDAWPTALTTAAVAGLVVGRVRTGAAALGLGAAAKLFPLVLVPLMLTDSLRRHGRSGVRAAIVGVLIAGSLVVVPFALLAPGGLGYSLETQLTRGLQIESLGGSFLLVADRIGLYDARVVIGDPYSLDLDGPLASAVGAALSGLQLVAVGVALLLYLRGPATPARLALCAVATVAVLVALGKVLSPQYLVWLIPLVPIGGRVPSALFLLACALTHGWFPGRFDEVVSVGGVSWVVLARNLVLVALCGVLLARLRPERPEVPRATHS